MGRMKDYLYDLQTEEEAMNELHQHLLDIGSEETLRYYQPTDEEMDLMYEEMVNKGSEHNDVPSEDDLDEFVYHKSIDEIFEGIDTSADPIELVNVELVDGETAVVNKEELGVLDKLPFNPLY